MKSKTQTSLFSSLRLASLAVAFAAGMVTTVVSPASAAFNEPDEQEIAAKEREKMLDVTVTPFKKDGTSGMVFEFTPYPSPASAAVAFHFGQPAGIQCFPRPEAPKPR